MDSDLHCDPVPHDPQARIASLLAAYRAAPNGSEVEMLHGVIESVENGVPVRTVPAVVMRIEGMTYALTMDETRTCIQIIERSLDPEEQHNTLRQLRHMLGYAVLKAEMFDGNRHVN